MYEFVSRVKEIKKVFTQFKIIEIALDSIIILLAVFITFTYLGVTSGWLVFVPSLIYIIIQLRYKLDQDVIKIIEERYPSLKERLSTVYDNKELSNAVIEELASSVLTDMERLRYSSFVAIKRLGIRVAIILLLVTFVLSSAIIPSSISGPKNILTISPAVNNNGAVDRPDTDIFNESSYVRIGDEAEGLMLYRGSVSELNVPGEGKQVSGYSGLFPPEASSSEMYGEGIPVIYQQIVKNYFMNLSGTE